MWRLAVSALLAALTWQPAPVTETVVRTFDVEAAGEVTLTMRAGCVQCDWGETGREAAVLRITVDGRYSQHVVLVRGEEPADYRVPLGAVDRGTHRVMFERDAALSARSAGRASIEIISTDILIQGPSATSQTKGPSSDFTAESMAPILYARPNTIGRFTDVPLLMWYEVVPTPRGRQFRYSVIFSNEDGGTATDRLMATWGRTTDIEFVYGAELDEAGHIVGEEYQGPGHEVPAFKGRHEGTHPLLYVSTDNNMVSETGTAQIRYALRPERFDLTNVSRELVMDRHPWTYTISAKEMVREGKMGGDPAPGSGKIPDLRRYVHVEACTELQNAAVAFAVRAVDPSGAVRWYDSDRGLPEFRIVRTGCFRGAVPLPAGASHPDAVRFRAFARPPRDQPSAAGSVLLTRINTAFMLDAQYQPGPSLMTWTGSVPLALGGDWREILFTR